MAIRNQYEGSSEGAVRHWEFPWGTVVRLSNNTPTPTQPAMVLSAVAGANITGTILTTDVVTVPHIAVIDVTRGMVYRHNLRNVLTYNPGVAELTWGAVNEGDAVYYDDSASMPADYFLSLSPLDTAGNANPVFGFVVAADNDDRARFPLAPTAVATSLTKVAIMQAGA